LPLFEEQQGFTILWLFTMCQRVVSCFSNLIMQMTPLFNIINSYDAISLFVHRNMYMLHIVSTTSVFWIADSRSPSSTCTVCKLNQRPYNWYLICCFCAKHAALRRKSKDRLARNQDIKCVCVGQHVYPQTVVSVN
jgi:hypothetical protein